MDGRRSRSARPDTRTAPGPGEVIPSTPFPSQGGPSFLSSQRNKLWGPPKPDHQARREAAPRPSRQPSTGHSPRRQENITPGPPSVGLGPPSTGLQLPSTGLRPPSTSPGPPPTGLGPFAGLRPSISSSRGEAPVHQTSPRPPGHPPRSPQTIRTPQHPWVQWAAASGTQRGPRRGGRPPAPKAASEPAHGSPPTAFQEGVGRMKNEEEEDKWR